MTPLDGQVVRRKLSRITENLLDLEPVAAKDLGWYLASRMQRKATERMLQETVDDAVDVNLHMLTAAGVPAPTDYHKTFVEAGRHGVIPTILAERLAPAAGLRNRIVHEYDRLDDAQVLAAVKHAVTDFREYVARVEEWLDARGL